MRRSSRSRATVLYAILVLLLALPTRVWAHAALTKSTPADHASVQAGPQTITLTFNSRLDAARSTLLLVLPDSTRRALTLEHQQQPNVLAAQVDLPRPGDYLIEWQVLSVDGHITRGVMHFHVASGQPSAHPSTHP